MGKAGSVTPCEAAVVRDKACRTICVALSLRRSTLRLEESAAKETAAEELVQRSTGARQESR